MCKHHKLRVKSLEHMLTEANCFISRALLLHQHHSLEAAQIYTRHQRASQGLYYTCANHVNSMPCTMVHCLSVCIVLALVPKLDKPMLLVRGGPS